MLSVKNKKIWLYLLAILVLLVHCWDYLPFLADDTLISLRYAQRFIEGKGLNWNDGEKVEGYSNLLWILLISLLGWLGMDLILASRLLGIAFTLGIFFFIFRREKGGSSLSQSLPLLFFALSMPIAVWAIGGLEQPLLAFLLAGALSYMLDFIEKPNTSHLLLVSLFLGLASITRPDAPLFAVCFALGLTIIRLFIEKKKIPIKDVAIMAIFPVLFYGGQLLFRIFYYGELVPNTALIKVSPSLNHSFDGLRYIFQAMRDGFPFSIIIIIAIAILLKYRKKMGVILGLTILINLAYLVFIGGDIFPAYRHFVPIYIISIFILQESGFYLDKLLNSKHQMMSSLHRKMVILFVLISISLFPFCHRMFGMRDFVKAEDFEWDIKEISGTLKKAFDKQQPLLAITAAGSYPYFTEFPCLDMLGLNDYYLPRNKPDDFGEGWIGHEMGCANYVLQRKPDIITFGSGVTPFFDFGEELANSDEFKREYKAIKIFGEDNETAFFLYFRINSEKIGISYSDSMIIIPGYLFGNKEHYALSGADSSLVLPYDEHFKSEISLNDSITGNIEINASNNHIKSNIWHKNGKTIVSLVGEARGRISEIRIIRD